MPGFETLNVAPLRSSMVILPALRALGQVVDRAHDAAHAELVGAADDRDDEAVGRVDGDADVDVAEDHVRVVEHARVELRVLAERARRRDDRRTRAS